MATKETIRIRKKKIASGNISLYLDIYRNGKREYEFLKLYLIPEKSRADKEKNRETMKLAEAIKAKRTVELQNKEFGFKNDYAEETRFFDYYESMCTKVTKSILNQRDYWRKNLLSSNQFGFPLISFLCHKKSLCRKSQNSYDEICRKSHNL